jgi:hypothetical protein
MWPTVRASDGERGGRGDLIQAVRGNPNKHYRMPWATPTAAAAKGTDSTISKGKRDLRHDVNMFPTPSASMMTSADMEQARYAGNSESRPSYESVSTGSLNPTFVEYLQNFPKDWTEVD